MPRCASGALDIWSEVICQGDTGYQTVHAQMFTRSLGYLIGSYLWVQLWILGSDLAASAYSSSPYPFQVAQYLFDIWPVTFQY